MRGLTRTIVLLAVVLVVFGVIAKLTSRSRLATVEGGGFVELLPDFDRAEVASIRAWTAAAPDSAVELARQGDQWVVATSWNWPAREQSVNTLLDDLSGLSGELRSSSPDVFADYDIADSNSFHLSASKAGGAEIFHIVVGKNARSGGFVRKSGSDDVYLAGKNLRSSFGIWGDEPKPPQAQRWLDLQVVALDRNDVDKIVIKNGKSTITLEKEFAEATPAEGDTTAAPAGPDRTQWTWKSDSKGSFHKVKTDGILSQVSTLYAAGVADPADSSEFGFDGPSARVIEITVHDGGVTRLFFGNAAEEEGKVYFRKEGGPAALVQKPPVDRIFVDRKTLMPADEKA